MSLFDRKLNSKIKEIKKRLKKNIEIEKLLRDIKTEFVWDEEALKKDIGEYTYEKVLVLAEKYQSIAEKYKKEIPQCEFLNFILKNTFMEVVEDLDSKIKDKQTSTKCRKNYKGFTEKDIQCLYDCHNEYLKNIWLNANRIYKNNMSLVFRYDISLEDILTRKERLPREIKQQIEQADERFWNNKYISKFKDMSLDDKNKNKSLFEEVVKNKKIWECFSDKKICQVFNRGINEFIQENAIEDLSTNYHDFDINCTGNIWENEYLKTAYIRCLTKVAEEIIYDERKIYNLIRPHGEHSFDIIIKKEIEKVYYDEKQSAKVIQTKIKRIFKENADLEDALDFLGLIFSGILCELRYETESHCNTSNSLYKFKKFEIEFAHDDKMVWVYEKKSNRVLAKMKVEEYYERVLDEDENSEKVWNIDDMRLYYEDLIGFEIKDDLDFIFQARQILDGEIKAVINGKGKSRHFSNCFEKILSLKDGLTSYESYIIEKQSGFYLSWMIYSRTVRLRSIKGSEVQTKIIEITKELSKIQNADIRLVIAERILDVLDEILCMEDMDIIQGMDVICGAIRSCVQHFNEKYILLYEVMLLIFTDEECLSNGKYRYQLLEGNKISLSDIFMNLEHKFENVYECFKLGKPIVAFKNVLYSTELNKIFQADANSSLHKWFRPIYEHIER